MNSARGKIPARQDEGGNGGDGKRRSRSHVLIVRVAIVAQVPALHGRAEASRKTREPSPSFLTKVVVRSISDERLTHVVQSFFRTSPNGGPLEVVKRLRRCCWRIGTVAGHEVDDGGQEEVGVVVRRHENLPRGGGEIRTICASLHVLVFLITPECK